MNDPSLELILNELIEIRAILESPERTSRPWFSKLSKDPKFKAKATEARNKAYEIKDKARAHEVNKVLDELKNKMGFAPSRTQLSKAVSLPCSTLTRLEKKGYIKLKQA